ncbi:MAG: YodL domain-containing protein [Eubacteriales bacterium]|nr:YodL domain-containing protein [Eubacteriales bacterium]
MSEKKKGKETEKWNEVNGGVSREILEAFLDSETDGYAILQLNKSEEVQDLRFMSYDAFERQGQTPEINFYDTLYAGQLTTQVQDPTMICESLFVKFNTDRPEDFTGHSLSVSDVIALKRQQEVNYYFVDSFGFKELPGFNSGRNPLRGIEDVMEQNDNQLDGVINNLPETTVSEKEAKTSVLDKLKVPAEESHKKAKSLCPEMDR